jgi:hypothetical protein
VSTHLLIVVEDPTHNGQIAYPLMQRMVAACGRPRARVTVLTNPHARGYASAKAIVTDVVPHRFPHVDLVLFLPDADGKDRSAEFDFLEESLRAAGVHLICCSAVQEIEAWALAGHAASLGLAWHAVRANVSVKEEVFTPFALRRGYRKAPDGGRGSLMQQTLRNYPALLQRCPELQTLEHRIRTALAAVEESER